MIILNSDNYIGKGKVRRCYFNEDKCIKIFHEGEDIRVDTIWKEIRELNRMASKKNANLIIPKYHGTAETNLGEGHVFDLVKDYDGAVSPTFKSYIAKFPEEAYLLRDTVHNALIKAAPVLYDISLENVLIQTSAMGEKHIAVIDGFGEDTFIRINTMIPFLARKKIKRKFKKFDSRLKKFVEKLPQEA